MGFVQELSTMVQFRSVQSTQGKLVVIDFGATWCGPCRHFEPHFESMAQRHTDVTFGKVTQDKDEGGDICGEAGIRSFPTIRFYINGNQVDEMVGANPAGCESKVSALKAGISRPFSGEGFSMGASSAPMEHSAAAAREARLKRFGDSAPPAQPPAPMEADDEAELQAALAMSMDEDAKAASDSGPVAAAAAETAPSKSAAPTAESISAAESAADAAEDAADAAELAGLDEAPEMVMPPVNETLLAEVIAMGFPEVRVRKALMAGSSNADAAVTWVLEHGEDPGIDDPVALVAKGGGGGGGGVISKSWKCEETGRLFRTMEEVQMYAEKTGRANFSESTEEKKPLTAEEIVAKKAALQAKIAARRLERDETEKVDSIQQEKQRRTMGKEMGATREQMEKEKRLRDFAVMKKEKQAQKLERERLRAEIAKDKAERKARGGKLNSVLGKDGYNPSGMSAQISGELEAADRSEAGGEGASSSSAAASPAKSCGATNEGAVDQAIDAISRYKVGGDGGKALKLLGLYVKNAIEKPDEDKYRSINTDSNAFKTKVAPLKGGVALLKAIGFEKNESSLDLSVEVRDMELLSRTLVKLDAALAKYLG